MSFPVESLYGIILKLNVGCLESDLTTIRKFSLKDLIPKADPSMLCCFSTASKQLISEAAKDHLGRSRKTKWGTRQESLALEVARLGGKWSSVKKISVEQVKGRKKGQKKGQKKSGKEPNALDLELGLSTPTADFIVLCSVKSSPVGFNKDSSTGFEANASDYKMKLQAQNPESRIRRVVLYLQGTAPKKPLNGVVCAVGEDAWIFLSGRTDILNIIGDLEERAHQHPRCQALRNSIYEAEEKMYERLMESFLNSEYYQDSKIQWGRWVKDGSQIVVTKKKKAWEEDKNRDSYRLLHKSLTEHLFKPGMKVFVDQDALETWEKPGPVHLKRAIKSGLPCVPLFHSYSRRGYINILWWVVPDPNSSENLICAVNPWHVSPNESAVYHPLPESLGEIPEDEVAVFDLFEGGGGLSDPPKE